MLVYEDIKKIRLEYSISQTKLAEFKGTDFGMGVRKKNSCKIRN